MRGCEISKVAGFLKRKMNQLNVIRRDFHHRTFRMPGTEYHAKSRLLVGDKFMYRRAMGMSVDQPLHLMFLHRTDYRVLVNVHDRQRFTAVGFFTVRSHSRGNAFAHKQRQGEE